MFQKIFERGLEEQKKILLTALWGNIVNFSLHAYGCRVVQKAIECQKGVQEIESKFIDEIMKSPLLLIENQNGNHVVQKCF